ncbi:hypothetical protein ACIQI7_33770 [Kitasatospora sp. NPDC092039]|uniref:hypothetical protein n=1 Tax=Kitasatospora sp. NPDC092039 TaxID=3364086 RepID=UPI003805EA32
MNNMDETSPPAAPAEQSWTPQEGEVVTLLKTGEFMRIMSIHSFGVFVRPVRGGREQIKRLWELVPPDTAPGGFNDWQASRG